MLHTPTLPPLTEYKLLKIVLDDNNDKLRVIESDAAAPQPKPIKKAAPQQVVAAMAFRLLGLDAQPVYKTGKAVMWQADGLTNNTSETYKNSIGAVSQAAQVLRSFINGSDVAKHGQVERNNIADYLCDLATSKEDADVISFSKILGSKEIVIVHNTSETEAKEKFILLNHNVNGKNKNLTTVYGFDTCGQIHLFHNRQGGVDISYIKIYLKPLHMVILKNY